MTEEEFAKYTLTLIFIIVVLMITNYSVIGLWIDLIKNNFNLNYISDDDRWQITKFRDDELKREYHEWRMTSESSDHLAKSSEIMKGGSSTGDTRRKIMVEKRQIPEHLKLLLVTALGTILLSNDNTLLKTRQLIEVVEEFYDLGFCDGNINGIEVASETMTKEILKAIKPTGMVN